MADTTINGFWQRWLRGRLTSSFVTDPAFRAFYEDRARTASNDEERRDG